MPEISGGVPFQALEVLKRILLDWSEKGSFFWTGRDTPELRAIFKIFEYILDMKLSPNNNPDLQVTKDNPAKAVLLPKMLYIKHYQTRVWMTQLMSFIASCICNTTNLHVARMQRKTCHTHATIAINIRPAETNVAPARKASQ